MSSELKTYYEKLAAYLKSDRPTSEEIQELRLAAKAADAVRVDTEKGNPLLEHSLMQRLSRLKQGEKMAWKVLETALMMHPELKDDFDDIHYHIKRSHLRSVPPSA